MKTNLNCEIATVVRPPEDLLDRRANLLDDLVLVQKVDLQVKTSAKVVRLWPRDIEEACRERTSFFVGWTLTSMFSVSIIRLAVQDQSESGHGVEKEGKREERT